jgi:hypothetical protein
MFGRFERTESASTTVEERPVERSNETTALGALVGNAGDRYHRRIDRAGYAS